MFRQDFTCPALLEDHLRFTRTGLSPALARLSSRFRLCRDDHWPGPRSLATTSGVSVDVLSSGYLDVSVPRVRLLNLCIQSRITLRWGFPIRKSTDQSLLAAPHGLSQRATSFIASQCQGIHQMPLKRLILSRTVTHAQGKPHDTRPTDPKSTFPSSGPHRTKPNQTVSRRPAQASRCPCDPARSHFALTFFTMSQDPGNPVVPTAQHQASTPTGADPVPASPIVFSTDHVQRPQAPGSRSAALAHSTSRRGVRSHSVPSPLRTMLRHRPPSPNNLATDVLAKDMVEADGIEPTTSCLQSTRSPN